MNRDVAATVLGRGVTLAGSIIIVEAGDRTAAACDLAAAGAQIHADMFGEGFDLMKGASDELVRDIARTWPGRLDIHVMADNALDRIRGVALPCAVGRITMHVLPGTDTSGWRTTIGEVADEFWVSLDPLAFDLSSLTGLLRDSRPDGVLQMMAPAGVPGTTANFEKLDSDAWATARAHGPLGVDGGVTLEAIDRLISAGVTYFVMGRSLLGTP